MSFASFRTSPDAAHARQAQRADAAESQQRAAALRQQHEQATAQLRARLPFAWQVAQVRPRAPMPTAYQFGPPAFHVQLLEAHTLPGGGPAAQRQRAAGDWLCLALLDTGTGELRHDTEPAPDHDDGSGGLSAGYRPAPSCKRCLNLARQRYPNPSGG